MSTRLAALLCVAISAACRTDIAVTCDDGEAQVDTDGDEVPDGCVAVEAGGDEGDPCAHDHPCAEGLSCFFTECAGEDCQLDVGECSTSQA